MNTETIIEEIKGLPLEEKVKAINELKAALKKVSPFQNEPVDCVQWVKAELVIANDYNPNTVAPPRNGTFAHINTGRRIHSTDCCLSA